MDRSNSSSVSDLSSLARQRPVSTSKLFGNITVEMIDDFLEPRNKNLVSECKHNIKFVPMNENFGAGIIPTSDSDDDEKNTNSIPFGMRYNKVDSSSHEHDYVNPNKILLERALRESNKQNEAILSIKKSSVKIEKKLQTQEHKKCCFW